MPRRATPRDPEQTRKIIKTLRDKFFSDEAKETAARELERIEKRQAAAVLAERAPSPPRPAPKIEAPVSGGDEPFSDKERDQAWAILHLIKQMYGPDADKS